MLGKEQVKSLGNDIFTGNSRKNMKRRDFLKALTTGVMLVGFVPEVLAEIARVPSASPPEKHDDHIKDYIHKMRRFDEPHEDDICLDREGFRLLKFSLHRLKRLQRTVGHGNFHLLDFDDALKIARSYSKVGRFPKDELDFLETIFYEDGTRFGFLGKKPLKNLTDRIGKQKVVKVRRTGNYLYKGLPLETYKGIKQHLGDQVILTSGVRSVTKQFFLFLNKAYKSKGNLSLASRSLAPPGYSYHGIGDFDVGQVGFGSDNFSERFTSTKVYRRLVDLGYINLRYPRGNLLGVRFEPWHIKVNSNG